jgi:hypothetical protein
MALKLTQSLKEMRPYIQPECRYIYIVETCSLYIYMYILELVYRLQSYFFPLYAIRLTDF